MNTAEWILVAFLSTALLIFLILAIILIVKLIGITKEVNKIVITSQSIATKADDIVGNVQDMTSVGGIVKTIVNKYNSEQNKDKCNKKG